MKILLITPSYFPHRGGTEQVIFEVCKILSQNNDITILTQKRSRKWKSVEVIDNITVHRIRPLPHYLGNIFHFELKQVQLFNKAIQLHKKQNFDLIHNFHVFEFSKAVIKIKHKLKLPLITSLMGWDTFSPIKKIPQKKLHLVTRVLNNSDIVTSPSSHMAQVAKKDQGCIKDIKVIPHGTRMSEYTNIDDSTRYEIRQRHNLTSDATLFLSVQRIHKTKGLKYLLEAIPDIILNQPNTYFLFAGTGPELHTLQELTTKLKINSNVIWLGFQGEELPKYYSASDFFILPTLYESFGLVYVEALSFGLPVLSTSNGGTLDIINNDNGILFGKESSSEIVKAVKLAMKRKWNRKTIKTSSLQYSWTNLVLKYVNEYRKLVEHE